MVTASATASIVGDKRMRNSGRGATEAAERSSAPGGAGVPQVMVEASTLQGIANLAKEQDILRRRGFGRRFAHAVVGLEEQEDHEGDDQEVEQRLQHHA